MIKINPAEVFQERLAAALGLDKYSTIMHTASWVDVSTDADFQRYFDSYYKIRRNAAWRESYYQLFESIRQTPDCITFDYILDELYQRTGNIEASFASKMLASLRPEMPIWDQYVLHNLGLTVPSALDPHRIEKVKAVYRKMVRWYENFLTTDNAKECLTKFDEMLPAYAWLSDVKKIDCYLWSIR